MTDLRKLPILLLTAVALLAAPATSQSASYTYSGTGCTSGRLVPGIGEVPLTARNLPRIGRTFVVETEASTSYPMGVRRRTFLLTGTSNTATQSGLALPFDLGTLFPGEPVCGVLRTSDEVVLFLPFDLDYRAHVAVEIPIPNDPRLLGVTFHQQALSVELNTFGPIYRSIALSRAGTGVIGR